jgi:hypothetical protein
MRHASVTLVLLLLCWSGIAEGQVNTNPSGGLTINTLQIEDGGWAFVEFVESNTTITNNCGAANTLFGTFSKVLWLDPGQAGARDVFAMLLSLKMSGQKASGVTLYNQGSYCTLYALRTQ